MSTKNNTLLIDCGNTNLKWCLFDGIKLSTQQSLHHKDSSVLEVYKGLIENQASHCNSIVLVSVLGEVFSAGAKRIAEDANMNFIEAHSQEKLAGIKNGYKQPEKLGNDRLVAMVGAYELIDNAQACIVIDSGTATTIDAIDATGQHLGGVIFPGLELSLNSLSNNTELLPKLDFSLPQHQQQNEQQSGHEDSNQFEINGLATETSQAIATGCILSLASAIDGICNKMQRQLQLASTQCSIKSEEKIEIKRILCGGGAKMILPYLENDYNYHENVIMLGLKTIHINEMEPSSNND